MANFRLTPDQKKELQAQGYLIDHESVPGLFQHKRSYWDPRKDESGRIMGWTLPLPGDPLRMLIYLRRGFQLTDPQGNTAPPKGYFHMAPPMKSPTAPKTTEPEVSLSGGADIGEPAVNVLGTPKCPICQKEFPNNDKLITHMYHHRSGEAKAKASKKPKRGRKNKFAKMGVKGPEGGT